MNPRVITVKASKNYSLELMFDNGEHGLFSMLPYLQFPVFEPLQEISLFNQAHVTMGFVSWNDDIDMSPDTLYLYCKMTA